MAKEERADVDAADISEFVSLSLSLALSFFSAFAGNFCSVRALLRASVSEEKMLTFSISRRGTMAREKEKATNCG